MSIWYWLQQIFPSLSFPFTPNLISFFKLLGSHLFKHMLLHALYGIFGG